ncbi:MAG: trehalose-6-phosphate synthase [Thermodesulfobacteriota bacterium]
MPLTDPAPTLLHEGRTRLVAVSNRLPIALARAPGGRWTVKPGAGGLVTALVPVLRHRGGIWIGWSGLTGEEPDLPDLTSASRKVGYRLDMVHLTGEEQRLFYHGFANEVIWPLFHDLQTRCNFQPEYWYQYLAVNRKFAGAVADTSRPGDYVWIHDYHLMGVAQALKTLGVERQTGFFLHIPFPPVDIFLKLPWREQILQGLLDYDLIGFQTMRDRRNFVHCIQHIAPEARVHGRGAVVSLAIGSRQVRVGGFPISIDYEWFAAKAGSRQVADRAWYLHEELPDRQIILGVDRLDYTKGIPQRLEAFRTALARYPELHGKVTLVQVVVPSREGIPEYQALKARIEQMVGEINGRFTRGGWIPIQYLYRSLSQEELLAYYRAAEIALVTPLKDGMNLVAKEFCACSLEESGVLILSEFAGAAAELQRGALLVNPHDIEGVAATIRDAVQMPAAERTGRMRRLRETVRRHTIFRWVDSFLQAAFARKLTDFPALDRVHQEYVPEISLEAPADASGPTMATSPGQTGP